MDIISRLKQYIGYKRIPVTAFADKCGISRPSMSQLLNGRNKKVSHELIQHVHDAYPDLNVLWLMFGQGEMLNDVTGKSNKLADVTDDEATLDNFNVSLPGAGNINTPVDDTDYAGQYLDFSAIEDATEAATTGSMAADKMFRSVNGAENDENTPLDDAEQSFDVAQPKKIVSIIVYYSDNSFESFGPTFGNIR